MVHLWKLTLGQKMKSYQPMYFDCAAVSFVEKADMQIPFTIFGGL